MEKLEKELKDKNRRPTLAPFGNYSDVLRDVENNTDQSKEVDDSKRSEVSKTNNSSVVIEKKKGNKNDKVMYFCTFVFCVTFYSSKLLFLQPSSVLDKAGHELSAIRVTKGNKEKGGRAKVFDTSDDEEISENLKEMIGLSKASQSWSIY